MSIAMFTIPQMSQYPDKITYSVARSAYTTAESKIDICLWKPKTPASNNHSLESSTIKTARQTAPIPAPVRLFQLSHCENHGLCMKFLLLHPKPTPSTARLEVRIATCSSKKHKTIAFQTLNTFQALAVVSPNSLLCSTVSSRS